MHRHDGLGATCASHAVTDGCQLSALFVILLAWFGENYAIPRAAVASVHYYRLTYQVFVAIPSDLTDYCCANYMKAASSASTNVDWHELKNDMLLTRVWSLPNWDLASSQSQLRFRWRFMTNLKGLFITGPSAVEGSASKAPTLQCDFLYLFPVGFFRNFFCLQLRLVSGIIM